MTQTPRDAVLARERWEFDDEVTRVFDDMLERSIPAYQTMRALTSALGAQVLEAAPEPVARVVDVGCSRGGAIADLGARVTRPTRYLGLEVSPPMLDAARRRFESVNDGEGFATVKVRSWDLRQGLPTDILARNARVVLSVLTLQFVPIEYRARLLRQIFSSLREGGALLLVEKVLGATEQTQETIANLYHEHKALAGYTAEEIERKRLSLEGVLVPLTAAQNEDALRRAGFRSIECYWRNLNFAGWIAVKEAN